MEATPDVASVAASVNVTLERLNHPFEPSGPAGTDVMTVVGATASIFTLVVPATSTLPAMSTDQYVTTWAPGVATVTGPVYACVAPPSIV